MHQKPIYLDYMSTCPVDPEVMQVMQDCLGKEGIFGNPASSTHIYGYEASQAIENARKEVAEFINSDAKEIIWTSGATEANNLAIKGVADFYQRQGRHIITMATEHKSVLDPCAYLASQGFDITYLKPEKTGLLNLEVLKENLKNDTILVSIMWVNNETGVIQDIKKIASIVKEKGALLHIDAAQAAGRIPIDVKAIPIDLLSLSAHKVYGPKGVGALYVRGHPQVRLTPLLHGGGQEKNVRSGTLPTHQIVGMGKAFAIAKKNFAQDSANAQNLKTYLLSQLKSQLRDVQVIGDQNHCIANCLNLSFSDVDAEILLASLPRLALSTGSACNSGIPLPSHVLQNMGFSKIDAANALRISLGRYTSQEDIDIALQDLVEAVRQLQK